MAVQFWLCSIAIICLVMLLWSRMRVDDPRLPPKLPGGLPLIGHGFMLLFGLKRLWEIAERITKTVSENGGTLRMTVGTAKYFSGSSHASHFQEYLTPEDGLFFISQAQKLHYLLDPDSNKDSFARGLLLSLLLQKTILNVFLCTRHDTGKCTVENRIVISPVVTTNPEDFYKISNSCLEKDSMYFDLVKNLMTTGLLNAPVDTWRRHRKIISRSFNQRVLDGYMTAFNEHSRLLVDRLAPKVGKDAFQHDHYLERATLGFTMNTTMGVEEFDENLMEQFTDAVSTYFENRTICKVQKFLLINDFIYSFTSFKKKEDELIKCMHNFAERIIEKKKSAFQKDPPEDLSTKFRSVVDILLTDDSLTDMEIRDEVITTIIGSYDTTALSLTYILLMIGSYPEVQKKMYQELNQIFKGSNRDVEKEDLTNLPYLTAVIKESLRLYPIAPLLFRYIHQDVQLKHYTLTAGSNCILAIYGANRCPAWGPDSNEFKPERWINGDVPTNAFTSFSLGKRNCIGYRFGMMGMKVLLCHVLRRYRIYGDHTKVTLKYNFLLKPESGHEIRIEDRTSPDNNRNLA